MEILDFIMGELGLYILGAGILGLVIGFTLRGGCSKKIEKERASYEETIHNLHIEKDAQIKMLDEEIEHLVSNKNKDIQEIKQKHENEIANLIKVPKIEEQFPEPIFQQKKKKVDASVDEIVDMFEPEKIEKKVFAPTATMNPQKQIKEPAKINVTELLKQRGISLSKEEISLYSKYKINFQRSSNLQTSYPLEAIKLLNKDTITKLNEIEIKTTRDLANTDIDNLVLILGSNKEDALSWVAISDLLRLPGIDYNTARLISLSGINSVKEFAKIDVDKIFKKSVDVNAQYKLVPNIPNVNSLALWSRISSEL